MAAEPASWAAPGVFSGKKDGDQRGPLGQVAMASLATCVHVMEREQPQNDAHGKCHLESGGGAGQAAHGENGL